MRNESIGRLMRRSLALGGLVMLAAAAANAVENGDPAFGARGVILSSSPLGGAVAVGYGLTLDEHGNILIAGIASDESGVIHPALWRFQADGRPDRSFGRGGWTTAPEEGWGWSIGLDGRGRILVGGFRGRNLQSASAAFVRRFLSDGRPDASFGKDGAAVADSPLGGSSAKGFGLDVERSGSILLSGEASDSTGVVKAALWSFDSAGQADARFGQGGAAILPAPGKDARAFAVARRGAAIYVAGLEDSTRLGIWKLGATGTLDPAFASGGLADLGFGTGRALLFDRGGIWTAGYDYLNPENPGSHERTLLARFDSRGAPDPAFGTGDGRLLPGTKRLPDREAFAAAMAPDGSMALAGYASVGLQQTNPCFWRLDRKGHLKSGFGEAGVYTPPVSAGGHEERLFAIQIDGAGRPLAAGFSRDAKGKMWLVVYRLRSGR